jgi:hypothetical protein
MACTGQLSFVWNGSIFQREDFIITYLSAFATGNRFVYILAPDGYFEMAVELVVRTIDIRSPLKQADRTCGAAAKSTTLSAKIETAIPAEQQAARNCKMATECFSSHWHLAYVSVTTRMRISRFHCVAFVAFGVTGCCAAHVGRWSATFRNNTSASSSWTAWIGHLWLLWNIDTAPNSVQVSFQVS